MAARLARFLILEAAVEHLSGVRPASPSASLREGLGEKHSCLSLLPYDFEILARGSTGVLAVVLGGGRVEARLAPETVAPFCCEELVEDEVLANFSCVAGCPGRNLDRAEGPESPSMANREARNPGLLVEVAELARLWPGRDTSAGGPS